MKNISLQRLLKKQLMTYISISVLVLIIALVTNTAIRINQSNTQERDTVLDLVSIQMENFLSLYKNELYEIKALYENNQSPLLHDYYNNSPHSYSFEKLEYLDNDGRLIDSLPYDDVKIGFDYSHTAVFESGKSSPNNIVVGNMDFSSELEANLLPIIIKLDDGCLIGYYNTNNVAAALAKLDIGSDSAAIIDSNGLYIAHTDYTFVEERRINEHFKIFDSMNNNSPVTYNDQSHIISFKHDDVLNATIVYYESINEYIFYMVYSVIITLISMLFITAVINFIIHRQLIKLQVAFDKMQLATDKIAEGLYDYDVDGSYYSEISPLLDSFKHMGHEIELREEEIANLTHELEENFYMTITLMAKAIEAKDQYTGNHCERVMNFGLMIGKQIGLKEHDLNSLRYGGILHDVGKIGIPETVLNKPGSLTDQEYTIMKTHPEIGARILKNVPLLKSAIDIIHYHHEYVNGKGYPLGLKGDEIPLLARIASIADAFDAMTSLRPYRDHAMTHQEAMAELKRCSGTQFDPALVDAFEKALNMNHLID